MSQVGRIALPLLSGTLFGAGLAVGGMTDPARVRGFLDVLGAWDPTLAFVMAAAVTITAIAWRVQRGMAHPLFAEKWSLPERHDFDRRLVAGAILFGIGWGLAGLCPGPGFALLGVQLMDVLPFIGAMVAGMVLYHLSFERPDR